MSDPVSDVLRPRRHLRLYVIPLLALTGIGTLVLLRNHPREFVARRTSMAPTIRGNQSVLIDTEAFRHDKRPQRGDIVVFANPYSPKPGEEICADRGKREPGEETFVKRVIGLPNDVIEINIGKVFINGERINEPYLHPQRDTSDYGPLHVPRARYFVMGDNRANSQDSRFSLGPIPLGHLCGKVIEILN